MERVKGPDVRLLRPSSRLARGAADFRASRGPKDLPVKRGKLRFCNGFLRPLRLWAAILGLYHPCWVFRSIIIAVSPGVGSAERCGATGHVDNLRATVQAGGVSAWNCETKIRVGNWRQKQ